MGWRVVQVEREVLVWGIELPDRLRCTDVCILRPGMLLELHELTSITSGVLFV
jgi:hypothetical protein